MAVCVQHKHQRIVVIVVPVQLRRRKHLCIRVAAKAYPVPRAEYSAFKADLAKLFVQLRLPLFVGFGKFRAVRRPYGERLGNGLQSAGMVIMAVRQKQPLYLINAVFLQRAYQRVRVLLPPRVHKVEFAVRAYQCRVALFGVYEQYPYIVRRLGAARARQRGKHYAQ